MEGCVCVCVCVCRCVCACVQPFKKELAIMSINQVVSCQVQAAHPDSSDITYGLAGPHVPDNFEIDESSGEVTMLQPLDRDYWQGHDPWTVTVTATDNDLGDYSTGYSRVDLSLVDNNDNAPVFDVCCVEGLAIENNPGERYAMPLLTCRICHVSAHLQLLRHILVYQCWGFSLMW